MPNDRPRIGDLVCRTKSTKHTHARAKLAAKYCSCVDRLVWSVRCSALSLSRALANASCVVFLLCEFSLSLSLSLSLASICRTEYVKCVLSSFQAGTKRARMFLPCVYFITMSLSVQLVREIGGVCFFCSHIRSGRVHAVMAVCRCAVVRATVPIYRVPRFPFGLTLRLFARAESLRGRARVHVDDCERVFAPSSCAFCVRANNRYSPIFGLPL